MGATFLLILALVQGITEFLPISSSAHLILLPHVMGVADQGAALDVAVHVGTLAAVLLYFRRDTVGLAAAGLGTIGVRRARAAALASGHYRIFWALVVGTLPVLVAGFALKMNGVDGALRNPLLIASTSIIFGLLLYIGDRFGARVKSVSDMKIKPALLIGLAQTLALIPGTSRSGVTITVARALGFERQDAARFSMLLSIPTIIGAAVLTAGDMTVEQLQTQGVALMLAAAFACLAAMAAIHLFMRWLAHASMTPFVVYRIGLGALLFWIYL